MNRFIQEYGRLVLAIIVLAAFFIILGKVLLNRSDTKSIFGVQDKKTQTSSPMYSDTKSEDINEGGDIASSDTFSNLVGDVVESDTAPYFKIKETNDNQFGITKDAITYNDLFQSVRIYYKGQDVTDTTMVKGEKIKVTVLAYSYKPILERNQGDKNEHVVMEEVDAKDKYGHYIYDSDNNRIKELHPKYSISDSVVVGKNNYIDTSAKTCKVQVVYRVQIGSYKAECKVVYIKNRDGTATSTQGLTKIVFSND